MRKQLTFEFNTNTQNEYLAMKCLEKSDIGKFKQMLSDGMCLTAPMLNAMLYFGFGEEEIRSVLKMDGFVDDNVISWIEKHFEIDELIDILPLYDDILPVNYPSDEDCVKLKLWKALANRHKYDIVAENAPEVLEEVIEEGAWLALLKINFDKYVDKFFKERHFAVILKAGGWKYLIDHGKASYLLNRHLEPRNDIIHYCLEHNLDDVLYDTGYKDDLLANEHYQVFVERRSKYKPFLLGYPEYVDWEDLWNDETWQFRRDDLLSMAYTNKKVPACADFLKKHTTWWKRRKLFFCKS